MLPARVWALRVWAMVLTVLGAVEWAEDPSYSRKHGTRGGIVKCVGEDASLDLQSNLDNPPRFVELCLLVDFRVWSLISTVSSTIIRFGCAPGCPIIVIIVAVD